jgi:hypothetical protein
MHSFSGSCGWYNIAVSFRRSFCSLDISSQRSIWAMVYAGESGFLVKQPISFSLHFFKLEAQSLAFDAWGKAIPSIEKTIAV